MLQSRVWGGCFFQGDMFVLHHGVREEEVRLELQTIISSETFARSQQLSRLLRYLCDALLSGDIERLSEYAIGTEALGRSADFDPTQDAAVRVEMYRLRRRLREYYAGEGAVHTTRIEIPQGRYAPVVTQCGDTQNGEERKENGAEAQSTLESPAASSVPVAAGTVHPAPESHSVQRILISCALLVILLAVPAMWFPHRRATSRNGSPHGDTILAAAVLPAPPSDVRIGCGRARPWTDRLGQIWDADEYFEGGQELEIPPRPYIAGTFDAHLFQSARTGEFSYRIPLPNRTYEMRLYFIEPIYGPENPDGGEGNRLFRVAINGRQVLDRFDILTDADGPWIADVRVFKDISPDPDGYVRLDFRSITGGALVNAIEFIPSRRHILNPVRLLPQDNFYTDSAGNLWTPDNYSRGGRMAVHPDSVKNTRDQELFRHERYGRFRYAIPVDRGSYSVYLYMVEKYWGPGNQGGGGVNSRVFSVFCNGAALLRSIDLYKEAGIEYGIVHALHGLVPNAQGKLQLAFEPEHDYASLYGLEVLDEAGPDRPSFERTVNGAITR